MAETGILVLAVFALAVFSVAAVSGCVSQGPSCPQCPSPSAWSSCNDDAQKTRTNYRCGEETSYQCESYTEQEACRTSLSLAGQNGLSVTISPAVEETVKGIVKATLETVPSGVTKVWVMMTPQGWQPEEGEDPFTSPNVILQVEDASVGKSVYVDTANVENGVYTLGVMVTSNPSGAPWTDVVQTQLLVQN